MASNQNTYSSDSQAYETNDLSSVFKSLIRHTMHTFYSVPQALIVEYIYHYKCIDLKELATLLCLSINQVQSYIKDLKRDKFIIEEHRKKFEPDELFYKIDIITFINLVKYRLINMQLAIINSERQTCEQMNYKCQRCSKEYTEFDIVKLYQNNIEEDLICVECRGVLKDIHETNEKKRDDQTVDMRLFNEQMTPLYKILERIDQMMVNKQLSATDHKSEVVIDKHDDD